MEDRETDGSRHSLLFECRPGQQTMTVEDWPPYADPAGRYSVRRPPDWTVTNASADRTVLQDRGLRAQFAVEYSARDCAAAESELRERRLNYYLIREYTRMIGGREARVFEFRDTVANIREFRAFAQLAGVCCELKWTRPAGSPGQEFESTQEAMLFTFDFIDNPSHG